jgi:hypothetical protein
MICVDYNQSLLCPRAAIATDCNRPKSYTIGKLIDVFFFCKGSKNAKRGDCNENNELYQQVGRKVGRLNTGEENQVMKQSLIYSVQMKQQRDTAAGSAEGWNTRGDTEIVYLCKRRVREKLNGESRFYS